MSQAHEGVDKDHIQAGIARRQIFMRTNLREDLLNLKRKRTKDEINEIREERRHMTRNLDLSRFTNTAKLRLSRNTAQAEQLSTTTSPLEVIYFAQASPGTCGAVRIGPSAPDSEPRGLPGHY